MHFTGKSSADILQAHEGLMICLLGAGALAGLAYGVPIRSFVVTMIVIGLSCSISIFGAFESGWAIVIGIVYAIVIAALMYREWYDTPYGTQAGMFGITVPGLGDVMIDQAGRTRRDVDTEIRMLKRPLAE